MTNNTSNNKTIAKNATFLYLRLFISIAINFISSRLVLQALGVSDYGIYNVVGGVIVLINFISSALSMSTSRFLSYSLGKQDKDLVHKTFCTAFILHLTIACAFLIIAESIGLWFINTQLVIPSDRMGAANWVFQATIVSTFAGITQVPYNSMISSNEKFDVFAYIEILNTLLKLIVALTILHVTIDRLRLFSILTMVQALTIMTTYRVYCLKKFDESHFKWLLDKSLLKSMLSYSGWSLYYSGSLTTMQQCQNILINRFFGTIINAAAGVATVLQGVLYAFIGNITTAFNPQIIKEYARGNYQRVNTLINWGTIATSIFTVIISLPSIICLDTLMSLWLAEVPKGAVEICTILLVSNIFNSFNPLVAYGVIASGKVKYMNFICGTIYLIQIAVAYIVLKLTGNYLYMYICNLLNPILTGFTYSTLLKKYMQTFDVSIFYRKIYFRIILMSSITFLILWEIKDSISNQIISLIVITLISSIIVLFTTYVFIIDSNARKLLLNYVKNKIKR